MPKATLKSLGDDLAAVTAERDALQAEIQSLKEAAEAKEPWFSLDQKILLPESVDELRAFEYDGIKGYGAKVRFLAKRGGKPSSRTYEIDFTNNGFGPLADQVYNRIKSGKREAIVRGRHRQNDWTAPDGEEVTFDKWRAMSLKDIPVSKFDLPQESAKAEQPIAEPVGF